MVTCQNCGKSNSEDAKFCEYCGAKIEKSTYCPKCNYKSDNPNAKFCKECGTKLVTEDELLKLQNKEETSIKENQEKPPQSTPSPKTTPKKESSTEEENLTIPELFNSSMVDEEETRGHYIDNELIEKMEEEEDSILKHVEKREQEIEEEPQQTPQKEPATIKKEEEEKIEEEPQQTPTKKGENKSKKLKTFTIPPYQHLKYENGKYIFLKYEPDFLWNETINSSDTELLYFTGKFEIVYCEYKNGEYVVIKEEDKSRDFEYILNNFVIDDIDIDLVQLNEVLRTRDIDIFVDDDEEDEDIKILRYDYHGWCGLLHLTIKHNYSLSSRRITKYTMGSINIKIKHYTPYMGNSGYIEMPLDRITVDTDLDILDISSIVDYFKKQELKRQNRTYKPVLSDDYDNVDEKERLKRIEILRKENERKELRKKIREKNRKENERIRKAKIEAKIKEREIKLKEEEKELNKKEEKKRKLREEAEQRERDEINRRKEELLEELDKSELNNKDKFIKKIKNGEILTKYELRHQILNEQRHEDKLKQDSLIKEKEEAKLKYDALIKQKEEDETKESILKELSKTEYGNDYALKNKINKGKINTIKELNEEITKKILLKELTGLKLSNREQIIEDIKNGRITTTSQLKEIISKDLETKAVMKEILLERLEENMPENYDIREKIINEEITTLRLLEDEINRIKIIISNNKKEFIKEINKLNISSSNKTKLKSEIKSSSIVTREEFNRKIKKIKEDEQKNLLNELDNINPPNKKEIREQILSYKIESSYQLKQELNKIEQENIKKTLLEELKSNNLKYNIEKIIQTRIENGKITTKLQLEYEIKSRIEEYLKNELRDELINNPLKFQSKKDLEAKIESGEITTTQQIKDAIIIKRDDEEKQELKQEIYKHFLNYENTRDLQRKIDSGKITTKEQIRDAIKIKKEEESKGKLKERKPTQIEAEKRKQEEQVIEKEEEKEEKGFFSRLFRRNK